MHLEAIYYKNYMYIIMCNNFCQNGGCSNQNVLNTSPNYFQDTQLNKRNKVLHFNLCSFPKKENLLTIAVKTDNKISLYKITFLKTITYWYSQMSSFKAIQAQLWAWVFYAKIMLRISFRLPNFLSTVFMLRKWK